MTSKEKQAFDTFAKFVRDNMVCGSDDNMYHVEVWREFYELAYRVCPTTKVLYADLLEV